MTTRSAEDLWTVAADGLREMKPGGKTRDRERSIADLRTNPQPDEGVSSVEERVRVLPRRALTPPRIPPEVFLG